MKSAVRSRRSTGLYALALGLLGISLAAYAGLKPGSAAPDFSAQASLGGKVFTFSLAQALKQGPVVLYFYPAAFTSGCTVEAHEFAEATDKFKALGATVIGVSGDDIKTLESFSTKDCASKFPVAADPKGEVIAKYDVALSMPGLSEKLKMEHVSNRTSYLVAPDGTVLAVYSAMDASKHVSTMLDALKAWREAHKA